MLRPLFFCSVYYYVHSIFQSLRGRSMAFNMSDYLESGLINHLFRTSSFTKPTTLAIALCSGTISESMTGATIPELPFSNAYTRQTLNPLDANWATPTQVNGSGNTSNSSAITWSAASPAAWPTISGIAILDSSAYGSGNMLLYGALATPKTPGIGDQFQINIAGINVYLD